MTKFQYHIDCVICKGLGSLPVPPKKVLIMQCVHCGGYLIVVDVTYPKGRPFIDDETGTGMVVVEELSNEQFDALVKEGIIH